eukprot:gnl/Chilomastix_caulleri/5462.p1 GENE.gnl/Chilomastix_caulleri/5462~~gnl/Chilomastix_caulleri/5462.p1  ORF type:complete len:134 (-),score=6.15 gnl/Chilomastix_caulleri/5462:17-418(-)
MQRLQHYHHVQYTKSKLESWKVCERRTMIDNVLSRNYDDALAGLAMISPKAVDFAHSSGAAVALLCAKAREIAMKDEEAALRFLSEDVADAVAGVWDKVSCFKGLKFPSKGKETEPGTILSSDIASGLGVYCK